MSAKSVAALFLALVAIGASSCATSASSLTPDAVAKNEGAFFGHVAIFNENENVTSSCHAEFTDAKESRKTYLKLDESGWVFTSVKPGPTYFSGVLCTLGGLFKYNAYYETRDIVFDVPARGKLAYFGHVQIKLNYNSNDMAVAGVLAGGLGHALASNSASKKGQSAVENRFDVGVREYQNRFQKKATALTPFVAFTAKASAGQRVPASVKK